MKILIVSDTWAPQINGVARTLERMMTELTALGHNVKIVTPDAASPTSFPLPLYPEIILEFFAHRRLRAIVAEFNPDAIHIATEGPLGWAMRRECLRAGLSFSTAYHTHFPSYVAKRLPRLLANLGKEITAAILRVFHKASSIVMSPSRSTDLTLHRMGIKHTARWSRGVDTDLFHPSDKNYPPFADLPRPILLCVGRIAEEKNLHAFLTLATQGSKVVIGDGPLLESYRRTFPDAHFMGSMTSTELARAYAAADLFVFPSRTDTFGLVLLEAAASGLRIAAYPVGGPADIFPTPQSRKAAILDIDLGHAVARALALPDDKDAARAHALTFSWKNCAQQFLSNLQRALARTPQQRTTLS